MLILQKDHSPNHFSKVVLNLSHNITLTLRVTCLVGLYLVGRVVVGVRVRQLHVFWDR